MEILLCCALLGHLLLAVAIIKCPHEAHFRILPVVIGHPGFSLLFIDTTYFTYSFFCILYRMEVGRGVVMGGLGRFQGP